MDNFNVFSVLVLSGSPQIPDDECETEHEKRKRQVTVVG